MFVPKNILVPTDFSEYSEDAMSAAEEIARRFGAKLHLLHVVDLLPQMCTEEYCVDPLVVQQIEDESLRAAEKRLAAELARLRTAGLNVQMSVRQGAPYREILNEQQEKQIDLIVIATHGRTGLLSHLIGSVADKVSRTAHCSVLLIKR